MEESQTASSLFNTVIRSTSYLKATAYRYGKQETATHPEIQSLASTVDGIITNYGLVPAAGDFVFFLLGLLAWLPGLWKLEKLCDMLRKVPNMHNAMAAKVKAPRHVTNIIVQPRTALTCQKNAHVNDQKGCF